ncbi:hypothetical protein WH50_02405 [Pokkaliibacter plantistimulans]|uniref:P-type Zn(2+) transporter n=1 Tax=Pokkaliibacter plantistimulans TaxID=1635171 RepID=A0ABX5M360_9GAMM|nr:cation-translocating P-type ATPase [Pokkaliibacter plantistimulans]PXF32819.1 hypothetical protein WH50_02405 [Pokkaliibacter plantistimulans]
MDLHRHDHDHDHDHSHSHGAYRHQGGGCGCHHTGQDASAVVDQQSAQIQGRYQYLLHIPALDCANEEAQIRHGLTDMAGVQRLQFDTPAGRLRVHASENVLAQVLEQLKRMGLPGNPLAESTAQPAAAARSAWAGLPKLLLALTAAATSELVHWFEWGPSWLAAAFALVAIVLSGMSTYRKGWQALRYGNLSINGLMSIAVTGAVLIGQWPEAAMVMTLYVLGEWIEARTLASARSAIGKLVALVPEMAECQDAQGQWQSLPVKSVEAGQTLRVKPGQRIPLDGDISKGQGSVNQAAITGESEPVAVAEGDPVLAGALNGESTLQIRVSRTANDTLLAKILRRVEEAQHSQAPTQTLIERFSRIYTPAVAALAVVMALLPPLLGWGSWLEWCYRALVLLVIACPCALVISTPVTLMSGITRAARMGVMVKGGRYLEDARHLQQLALDKTGTITAGQPEVQQLDILSERYSEAQIHRWAWQMASASSHPVSQAITTALSPAGSGAHAVVTQLPGQGLQSQLEDEQGQPVSLYLVKPQFAQQRGLLSAQQQQQVEQYYADGCSVTLLITDHEALLLCSVRDPLKPGSADAIRQLHELGITTLMLTGDNARVAAAIAEQAGVRQVEADCLPDDKWQRIRALAQQAPIGMVGDGINDAPALAEAQVGFAMGKGGTDIAVETADVALMDDDLRKLPRFIRLSRFTFRVLQQNLVLAIGIKLLFVVLAALGMTSLWMAVFADVGASLLVIANGLRVLRYPS